MQLGLLVLEPATGRARGTIDLSRLFVAAIVAQHIAEQPVRRQKIGPELDRTSRGGFGLRQPVELDEEERVVVPSARKLRTLLERALEQRRRLGEPALRIEHAREHDARFGEIGAALERRLQKARRPLERTGRVEKLAEVVVRVRIAR